MSQFWSKIKTQYGSASQALSNLSLSNSEHDGDTETDTVIHKALVRYYTAKEGYAPQWLGVPQSAATPSSGRNYSNGLQNQSEQLPGRPLSSRSQSSLQEIYRRRQQQQLEQQEQQAQQQQQHLPIRGNAPTSSRPHMYSDNSNSSSDRRDNLRNKLRNAGGSRANW
ncbi:hypothetical protein AWJ20_2719 [Sugiyamaella lignohabitans]|uniref:Mso1 N-terminal domain-containing protein n=1 Tax=Sugiyamaella lignohabitans TaxID=796027 RepID=A0A167FC46_9ASCO|nr:uncharacterized protein AWJ20_2719 [Sugiyamaella lignohabitans]ANB15099.1 hypothetical protein AWJ20_2719 [Sugiyamaella lignohabitans]